MTVTADLSETAVKQKCLRLGVVGNIAIGIMSVTADLCNRHFMLLLACCH